MRILIVDDDEAFHQALSRAFQRRGLLPLQAGYASIATVVEAVKLGVRNQLPKPADADEILAALGGGAGGAVVLETAPMSVDRLEWEHIQKVLAEHDGNISETARSLGMHRRTLQRKLQKRPVRR